jgi:hypothetical protein
MAGFKKALAMSATLDAVWRSLIYCLHPKVILLSLMPVVLMVGLTGALGYFFWDTALEQIRAFLESTALLANAWAWLDSAGVGQLKTVLSPLVVLLVVTPVIVVLSMLLVSLLMTPAMVRLVARRRFASMERLQGASFGGSVVWSLGSTLMAVFAMLVSMPLWLVPPLVLVLPPLIWGWLAYRVMAFDALADHASAQERKVLLRRHRVQLIVMGVVAGYLGAAPSLIWSIGIMSIVMAPILVPVSILLYTLVFTFSSLWFTHYCLAALQRLRTENIPAP